MDVLRIILLSAVMFTFTGLVSYGQIESGKVEEKKEKPDKSRQKEEKVSAGHKEITVLKDPGTILYLGGGFGSAYRTLKPRPNYFGKELGEKANETAIYVPNFSIGGKLRIAKNIYFDLGISYAKTGEQYSFVASDTVYKYTNNYNYFAIPMKVQYIAGGKLKFIGGLGIQPQMVMSYRQHREWKTTKNLTHTETVKYSNTVELFNIALLADIGLQYEVGKNINIYLLPEFRYHITNTFGKQSPQIHKGYFIGGQIGVSFHIN